MRILIDGGSLQEDRLNAEKKEIIFHCLDILTKKEGGADWLLLVDESGPQNRLSDLPVEKESVKSLAGGIFGRRLWRARRVSSIIKRSGTTLLMTFNGNGLTGVSIPQCSWMNTTAQTGTAARGPAPIIFTFSEKDKSALIGQNGRPEASVYVIYGGPGEDFLPLPWVEREKAKIGFAAGKEYFLVFFNGLSGVDLVGILKAFSLFKKRQQSNMQLVFTGTGDPDADFQGKLKTYKYREDVHFRGDLPASSATKLVAGAYALISPFTKDATGLQILNAFQSAVPVITSAGGCQAEVAEEAALYAEFGDAAVLADRMMSVYKDESLRNSLIDKGKARLSAFSWEHSVQKLWGAIMESRQD